VPSLHMGNEIFRFQPEVIDRVVEPDQPGNYVLGEKDEAGEFYPKFIGRSDTDLNAELKSKFGLLSYTFFKSSIAHPRAAYDLECAQYHSFKSQLDNKQHPAGPAGSDLTCFLCGL
jgi:hypothetical protein